jgi:soluble lytic murein transglycosylase-like protein
MQVMPATAVVTARELGVALDARVAARFLTDPFTNLTFGVSYLSWLRDHYRGRSAYFLVAAYNVGPARMDELLLRKSFTPVVTKRYFNAIRRGVPGFRYYRREA